VGCRRHLKLRLVESNVHKAYNDYAGGRADGTNVLVVAT